MSDDLFSSQRVAIFMDVQSLYYGCRDQFDNSTARVQYEPLLRHVVGPRLLVKATAYLRYNREADTHKFHRALNEMGFEVRSKPAKDFMDRPQSWVVGMLLDMVDFSEKMDLAILLSHDVGFADALSELKSRGIPVELWGFKDIMDSSLKQEAVKFHFFPDSGDLFTFKERAAAFHDSEPLVKAI